MSAAPAPRPVAALGGALVGALAYGVIDAVRVLWADTLRPTAGRGLTLAVVDALGLAVVGLGLGLVLWLLAAGPLRRRVHQPLGLGLLLSLAACFLLDLGEGWFKAPAPFTEPPPLHGNAPVFAVLALVLLGLPVALSALRSAGPALGAAALALLGLGARAGLDARSVPAGEAQPPAGARSVLLVTMDTSRADYFGAYGRTDVRTPSFDRIAAEGVRLDHAYSQIPVTGPSHATIMTGVPPWEHGNLLNGLPVAPGYATLPEELRRRGWRTAAFVSAYVLDGKLGFSRGFEVYDDDFGWLQGFDETVPGRLLAMAERFTNPDHVLERIGGRTTDAALDWMDREVEDGQPFFVWVHLFDPHGPYAPPPPWDTAYYQGDPRDPAHTSMQGAQNIAAYLVPSLQGITDADYVLAQYAGEVSYVDDQIGRLLGWLEARGRLDDTLVIAVADHGESLAGEHGVWFNHGDDLYEASTWIPWAMRLPGGAHAGAVLQSPAELTDLAPTVYEVLDLPLPETAVGHSLLPALQTGEHRAFARGMCFDRPINQELRRKGELDKPTWRIAALRTATTRFIDHEYQDLPSEHWSVTGPDPFRTETRAPISIPEENALGELTAGLLASGDVGRSQAEQSEDAIRKLQALGYMEE